MSNDTSSPAVGEILRELREEVRKRRAMIGDTLPGDGLPATAFNARELRKSVAEVSDGWHVSAHLPVAWKTPVLGRLVAYWKRGCRILLRWYINPIVDQQNAFNASVARTVRQLAAYQDRLASELRLIDERLAELERASGHLNREDNPGGPSE